MPVGAAKPAPLPSIRRLPLYLGYLKTLDPEQYVSCTQISDNLDVYPVQARKDIAITGVVGKPKVGYNVTALVDAIEHYLGWNRQTTAVLVGAGNLGSALLGYAPFNDCGFSVVAAVDADTDKVGQQIHACEVFGLDAIEDLIAERGISVGILTIPGQFAQAMADRLVAAGVRGLWNFTPTKISAPDPVVVESVQLASSLAVLTGRLQTAEPTD